MKLAGVLVQQPVPKDWTFHSVNFVWNAVAAPKSVNVAELANSQVASPVVREFVEPRIGIPVVRNRALDIARRDGLTHIVFIDDDCLPREDWLVSLLQVIDETGADVVAGGWRITAEGCPSPWLPPRVFGTKHYYFAGANAKSLDNIPTAYTRNVVLSTRMLDRLPTRHQVFPESMTATGGSDSVFFARAHLAGAKIVYAPDAKVEEKYDGSRLTLRWHLLRRVRNTQVRLRRRKETREPLVHPKALFGSLGLSLLALPASLIVLPLALFSSQMKRLVGSALLHMAPLLGALLWGVRIEYREYAGRFGIRSR